MSSKSENLPANWIRKESRSCPNKFYYFNTKTRQTQWMKPANDVHTADKTPQNNQNKESESNRFKINSKSKNVKKSKTPAQDRLEKAKISFKTPTKPASGKKPEYVSNNNKERKESWSRSDNPEPKRQRLVTPSKKKSAAVVSSIIEHIKNKTESGADIPKIFDLKTPAQNRLTKLRKKLEADINSEMLNVEQVNNNNDSLHVIQNGFGIETKSDVVDAGNLSSSIVQNGDDMEMDWEPSFTEDPNQTEFSLQCIEDIVFEDLNESTYIVPDTNVFLDSLVCICNIIEKDKKYCVLVPFVVLQELDGLKSRTGNSTIQNSASAAIRFIYNQLKSRNQHLQGQKATDDKQHVIDVKSADDKILNCCLQLQGQRKEVILVTNDINLSNKALTSGIEAITSRECMKKYNL